MTMKILRDVGNKSRAALSRDTFNLSVEKTFYVNFMVTKIFDVNFVTAVAKTFHSELNCLYVLPSNSFQT